MKRGTKFLRYSLSDLIVNKQLLSITNLQKKNKERNEKQDKYIQCKLVHCNPNAKLHSHHYKELINWVKTEHADSGCLIQTCTLPVAPIELLVFQKVSS